MFETSMFTRTRETEAEYRTRSTAILERFASETGKDWDRNSAELLTWLRTQRDTHYSAASWRKCRAMLRWLMYELGFEELGDEIQRIATPTAKPKKRRTSALKKKSVSDEEFLALAEYLCTPNASKTSVAAFNFFASGMLTGLRPCEWEYSEIEIIATPTATGHPAPGGTPLTEDPRIPGATLGDGRLRLTVRNAKSTNGRSNGETRTLILDRLTRTEHDVLLAHWYLARDHAGRGTYKAFQEACRVKIRYAAQKLWPKKNKRVSLYSTRHQSMANCKAEGGAGLPKNVTAALHGHASDRTNTDHYGRKQYGHSGRVKATAPAEQIESVREVSKDWQPPQRTPTPRK